jgi:hypothetical protein
MPPRMLAAVAGQLCSPGRGTDAPQRPTQPAASTLSSTTRATEYKLVRHSDWNHRPPPGLELDALARSPVEPAMDCTQSGGGGGRVKGPTLIPLTASAAPSLGGTPQAVFLKPCRGATPGRPDV